MQGRENLPKIVTKIIDNVRACRDNATAIGALHKNIEDFVSQLGTYKDEIPKAKAKDVVFISIMVTSGMESAIKSLRVMPKSLETVSISYQQKIVECTFAVMESLTQRKQELIKSSAPKQPVQPQVSKSGQSFVMEMSKINVSEKTKMNSTAKAQTSYGALEDSERKDSSCAIKKT